MSKICHHLLIVCGLVFLSVFAHAADQQKGAGAFSGSTVKIEDSYFKYEIGSDGRNLHFINKATGKDYYRLPGTAFAGIKKAGREYPSTKVSNANGRVTVEFGDSGVSAVLQVKIEKSYVTLEVLSVSEQVECLTFLDIPLTGDPEGRFVASAMALNLKTKVVDLPGPMDNLQAACYSHFGLAGAKVAIVACPLSRMRSIMKTVVSAAPDLPHSNIGGPWAMDAQINRGSYMLEGDGITTENVNDWIRVAKTLGITQYDFNIGVTMRYGDFLPNPKKYPKGFESVKAVIDRLHSAGIKAGLHTYSCFVAKESKYVSPVPDPRLAKDATFTLAESLTSDATTVTVAESTEKMTTTLGFFAGNSVTIQIDDELITYSGISKNAPYGFTGCVRGACGTKATAHAASAKVHHLKEMFFLFAPDPDSTMLAEVAQNTADTYNACGFDMIYLDAIDGMYVLSAPEDTWHYASEFVFDIAKRLNRPALMEMSDMHHLFWYVRSRMGAWDVPFRGQKSLIAAHTIANKGYQQKFLPTQLGWWLAFTYNGIQPERSFSDDVEYLCGKSLAYDSGLSFVEAFTLESFFKSQNWLRLAGIIRQYEELRLRNYFPESVKKKLAVRGDEFTLEQAKKGLWQFIPVKYSKTKVQGSTGQWYCMNNCTKQPLRVRIEALKVAAPYDSSDGVTLLDFSKPEELIEMISADNVKANLTASTLQLKVGSVSGCMTALNSRKDGIGAYSKIGRILSPEIDLKEPRALGLWVYGDGNGEIINIQLKSPAYVGLAYQDHYITVDFTGWRYFELVEAEGRRIAEYEWPYTPRYEDWDAKPQQVLSSVYPTYITPLNYNHIDAISVWYNNLPKGNNVECYLSPIKALPALDAKIKNPSITIAGRKIMFPVELDSGSYIEFVSMTDCKVYSSNGDLIGDVKPVGEVPVLEAGKNMIDYNCEVPGGDGRVEVTVIGRGKPVN